MNQEVCIVPNSGYDEEYQENLQYYEYHSFEEIDFYRQYAKEEVEMYYTTPENIQNMTN